MRPGLNPNLIRERCASRRALMNVRQRGLTLVEIMISLAIGFVLLLGMSFLIAEQSRDRGEIDKAGRQIENGRYAMMLLRDEIQHAGYYGEYGAAITALTSLPNPCEVTTVATIEAALAMPLQGYNAPAAAALPSCLPSANHVSGTDVLVVRRAATAVTALGSLDAAAIYLQTTPAKKLMATGAVPASFNLLKKDDTTVADIRRYVVHIYFVSPCNVPASGTTCTSAADNGRPIPTLKRLELSTSGGAAAFTTTALVEGIENMQIDYHLDSTNTGVPDFPGVTAPAVATWPNVMQVQVHLLARNNEGSIGHTDTKTYSLGLAGTVGPFGDAFKRHVYSGIVRVMNVSQRRE